MIYVDALNRWFITGIGKVAYITDPSSEANWTIVAVVDVVWPRFYWTGSLLVIVGVDAGASVGDMFTSLIHTAELHDQNPFEYLTAVLRHSALAALQPGDWLPWTYKATLARLGEQRGE